MTNSQKIQASTSGAASCRNIKELQDMDFITVENGLHLTDAGRIARL